MDLGVSDRSFVDVGGTTALVASSLGDRVAYMIGAVPNIDGGTDFGA
jgi:sugar/nucleoside kinase (ribokinase family)